MCRKKFKSTGQKGFPLKNIGDTLGTTKAIASVIPHIDEEIPLLDLIMEEAEEDDTHDVVVASWMWRLRRGLPVLLEEMYTADVATRSGQNDANEEIDANEQPREDTIELVDLLRTMKQDMKTQFDNISVKIDGLEKRIEPLEVYVKEQEKSKVILRNTIVILGNTSKSKVLTKFGFMSVACR
ncbi:PREDICTED: uncharacterized protein At3g43530-like [Camelina sativa]|uniref:Uncharacterized protein At3g43530-like n=1 Tax=Camelina sativa TaxID=90675 RepID=A0ABM1RIY6_CAMSA|nr:PREDICTED: uncharacterized protein At3g43530-like [Camelina sativa]